MKSWCIGQPCARFVAKREDVLGVYQRPYDPKRPVVCLDEKSKELHASPRATLPASPAQGDKPAAVARQDYEYQRNGTRNLFLWVDPLAGRRHVGVTERRRSPDFAHQIKALVDEHYPQAEVVVLVTDNLNTHSAACLYALRRLPVRDVPARRGAAHRRQTGVALHARARQLAEHGRDRAVGVGAPVPAAAPPGPADAGTGDGGVAREAQPSADGHPLAVHGGGRADQVAPAVPGDGP